MQSGRGRHHDRDRNEIGKCHADISIEPDALERTLALLRSAF
jgi:hypothetical protein